MTIKKEIMGTVVELRKRFHIFEASQPWDDDCMYVVWDYPEKGVWSSFFFFSLSSDMKLISFTDFLYEDRAFEAVLEFFNLNKNEFTKSQVKYMSPDILRSRTQNLKR